MASKPASNAIPAVDWLRGIAILAVYWFHAYGASFGGTDVPWLNWDHFAGWSVVRRLTIPMTLGWTGVAIFFALSGFCIHLSFGRAKRQSVVEFAIRRFFRIYPTYLAATLFFFFVPPFGSWEASWPRFWQLLTHILLIHNTSEFTLFGINGSFWSIAVEAQLYVLYPLLYLFGKRYGWRRVLVASAAIELGLRCWMSVLILTGRPPLPTLIVHSPFAYLMSWVSGAYLAEEFMHGRRLPFRHLSVWHWIGTVLVLMAVPPLSPFAFPSAAIATIVFLSKRLKQQTLSRLACGGAVGFVGVVSYSFYLIHQPILVFLTAKAAGAAAEPLAGVWGLIVGVSLLTPLLLLSWLGYRWVELPSIELGKRICRSLLPDGSKKAKAVEPPLSRSRSADTVGPLV